MSAAAAAPVWREIGKDAHMAKHPQGFVHVMKISRTLWSVTLNGRVAGSAASAAEGKELAERVLTW